jgi:hypothetical protein
MRQLISNLFWIGNARDARDVKGVLNQGIEVVIDLAMEELPIQFPREVTYCRFPLLDSDGNSPAMLRSAIETTTSFVSSDLPTLVACSNGMSRSPVIAAAVLAKLVESLDLEQAVESVAKLGPCDIAPGLWADVKACWDNIGRAMVREFLTTTINVFEYHKRLADRAIEQVDDEKLHVSLDPNTNSIAVVMKHIAGNLLSRWTDFLTTDGEKPDRNRDGEFIDTFTSRAELLEYWERGWNCLFNSLKNLTPTDLTKTVSVRGEPHSVPLALERSLGHTCYHIGQVIQTARIQAGENWKTLTIPRGGSEEFNQKN